MNGALAVVAAGLLALAADAAWVATRPAGHAPPATGGSLDEAQAAVRTFVAAAAALRASGGDPRIAERVPAGPELLRELLAELAFARRELGAPAERQELVRLEVLGAAWREFATAEVRTREFWIFRRSLPGGAGEARPSAVWEVRYELARDRASWRVIDYRLEAVQAPAEAR